jgi:hypothetical protein
LSLDFQPMYLKKLNLLLQTIALFFCLQACEIKPVERSSDILLICETEIGDKKVPCTVQIPGTNAVLNASLKKRGQSSRIYPKASYTIEFEQNVGFCSLTGDDDWVLNAAYIDKILMRNRLCYDLFRLMSPENIAPQICYQSVSLNGIPLGIYLVTEPIDPKRTGIKKSNPGAMLFKEPAVFSALSDSSTGEKKYLGQKFPKAKELDLSDSLRQFSRCFIECDDLAFQQLILKKFDLNNLADWLLLLHFSNNDDGLFRNFYLYRTKSIEPIRIAIWDYDECFGRLGDGTLDDGSLKVNFENHRLLSRLLRWDEFRKLLKGRWSLHRQMVITETAMNTRIDFYLKELKPMLEENKNLWPPDGPGYKDASTFEEEVELLRNSINIRLLATDAFVEAL